MQINERLISKFASYRKDPVLFVREIFGATPTAQQEQLLKAIAKDNAHVAVKSGHGVGKTSCWLGLYYGSSGQG